MTLQIAIVVIAFLTLLATLIGLVPVWVPFLQERPHLLRRAARPLGWLRRWWRLVFANLVLVLITYIMWIRPDVQLVAVLVAVVLLLLVFWGEVRAGQSNWRDRWRKWRRESYVSALSRAARPVRADLWARLRADAADDVRGLKTDSLKVLQFALAALDPCAPWPCYVPAVGVFFEDVTGKTWAPRLEQACSELVRSRMASRYHRDPRGVELWLRTGTREADETGELSRLVTRDLERRDMEKSVRGPATPAEDATPYDRYRDKVRDISRVEGAVIHYLLQQYDYQPFDNVINVDVDNPEILTSPLKDLDRDDLKAACKKLIEREFLLDVHWLPRPGGERLLALLPECLRNRIATRAVAGWVDEEMRGRGYW